MFARTLVKAPHVRRFTITQKSTSGWEVRDETDSSTRSFHYEDWHRVERARRTFDLVAEELHASGWTEEHYSTKR